MASTQRTTKTVNRSLSRKLFYFSILYLIILNRSGFGRVECWDDWIAYNEAPKVHMHYSLTQMRKGNKKPLPLPSLTASLNTTKSLSRGKSAFFCWSSLMDPIHGITDKLLEALPSETFINTFFLSMLTSSQLFLACGDIRNEWEIHAFALNRGNILQVASH